MLAFNQQGRVRVKICGITDFNDAQMAVDFGADALGFNGFRGSKRYLELAHAADWISGLPQFVSRVAVLVNPTMAEINQILELGCFDTIQLHGHETPSFCCEVAKSKVRLIKAVAVQETSDLAEIETFSTRTILLDTFKKGAFGGTGETFNWKLAKAVRERFPNIALVLSGGLQAQNVAEAIASVQPYAVDVASGVECPGNPRKKSAERLRAFFQNIR